MNKMLWAIAVLALALALAWWALTQPLVRAAPEGPVAAIDAARLEAHVQKLAGELCPRDAAHAANLDRAAAWIAAELEAAGARVSEQPFRAAEATYRNVIGAFGPEGGARIVVGAHYDAAGPHPGADDNASGVAGLLELARALGAGAPPAHRVELVAWTLEEQAFGTALMGSAVHAAALREEGSEVVAAISLEMIGYFDERPGTQALPAAWLKPLYPDAGNFIAVVGLIGQGRLVRRIKGAMLAAGDLPVESLNGLRSIRGVDFSDHRSYWEQGYPGVMITDTAFYRNPHYHEAGDLPETLDYGRMAQVVAGVHQAVLALDRAGR